jgi:hypothetical protein
MKTGSMSINRLVRNKQKENKCYVDHLHFDSKVGILALNILGYQGPIEEGSAHTCQQDMPNEEVFFVKEKNMMR